MIGARIRKTLGALCMLAVWTGAAGQCTNVTIAVTGGAYPGEIYWELSNTSGVLFASGGAPATVTVCLPAGTYYMDMFDWYGDGWNGAAYTIRCPNNTIISTGTLNFGSYGWTSFTLTNTTCGNVSSCPGGTSPYTLQVTNGFYPSEIGWQLIINGQDVADGGAGQTVNLCLAPGCYEFFMFDEFGDGWDGATYTLTNSSGAVVYSGTLGNGYVGNTFWAIGGSSCNSSNPVTASDCSSAVNVCNNLNFTIDPNGFGQVVEISPPGSYSNPVYYWADGIPSPWGSDNEGCLLNGEINSTWMIVNIWGGGSLEFTFGGLGTQAGYYDWIMFPYNAGTCQGVYNDLIPPVRCNWNAVSYGGTGLAAATPSGGFSGNYEPPLNVQAGQQYLIVFSNWSSASTVVPLQFGGTAIVSCQNVLMPVELAGFSGFEVAGGDVQLEWATLSEHQSAWFLVETRTDEQAGWREVGMVPAAGESTELLKYRLEDLEAAPGLNYYRLIEEDQDGIRRPVGECAVRVGGGTDEPWVFPNPVQGRFHIPEWMRGEDVRVYDGSGREVSFHISESCADCPAELELRNPHAGVYYLVNTRIGGGRPFVVVE